MSKSQFTVETYTAPSYWAILFFNGDDSGMEADEIEAANKFLKWVGLGDPTGCEEIGFSYHCDANKVGYSLGGDMAEYTFLRRRK